MINNILHNALLASNKFDWNTPLTFTAEEANSTIQLGSGSPLHIPYFDYVEYRTNRNSSWSTYTINTTITLTNVGDYVQFQNTYEQLSDVQHVKRFVMSGKIAASGNIQSMLNYSTSCPERCYSLMFAACTSLTKAPDLPATKLAPYCYEQMFRGCDNLTSAPELPATNLAPYCYQYMFYNCTNLKYINVGFTDWNSTESSTANWLSFVSLSGTFECPKELDTTQRGDNYIPDGWTIETY